jgi:hypothetical protein
MEEVRHLINNNKRVATVWHRNQGPAFLAHFSNSIMDEKYILPDEVKMVRLTDLLNNMADILNKYGSVALKQDIADHIQDILQYAAECNTADKLISRLINEEEKWPIPQEF